MRKNYSEINIAWVKSRNTYEKFSVQWLGLYEKKYETQLRDFAETGQAPNSGVSISTPLNNGWEFGLSGVGQPLDMYARAKFYRISSKSKEVNAFDPTLALEAFSAACLIQFIPVHYVLHGKENGCEIAQDITDLELTQYTAIGIIIGCGEKAFRMARLQMCLRRENRFRHEDSYPIFHFMLRLIGDYLGERPFELVGDSLKEPLFLELFEIWRQPDPNTIADLCIAACNYHTWRCGKPPSDDLQEFESGPFARMPIEILLLFKLRQMLGLDNPKLDHPLMNTALGVLPPEIAFETLAEGEGTLIHRVRERMMLDGYDEQEIFASFYTP